MSPRSRKQLLAVGFEQVTGVPSTTSSGKPLTSASVPSGTEAVGPDGFHPVSMPPFFTSLVWLTSTQLGPNAIQP